MTTYGLHTEEHGYERVLRTGQAIGVHPDSLLSSVLVAELLSPSAELWLVSPWISDVPALDNTRGDFDSLFSAPETSVYPLSQVLGLLTHAGAKLTVVHRPDKQNERFLTRLGRRAHSDRLKIISGEVEHEKTLCGHDWYISGSMNFTFNGMQVNDEAITYRVSLELAASTRIDFRRRWEEQPS